METTDSRKSVTRFTAILSTVVVAVILSQSVTFAGFGGVMGGASTLRSRGPCTYCEQLKTKVAARQDFLIKIEIAGGTAGAGGAVDDMYGGVVPASYSPKTGSDDTDMWGFGGGSAESAPGGIDELSATCISCHDGVGAVSVEVDLRNNPFARKGAHRVTSDHPIGMEYTSYAGAGRGFKPLMGDTSRMVFVNGRVTCLTCHDPLNSEKGHLVMSDRNSALCLTCHDK